MSFTTSGLTIFSFLSTVVERKVQKQCGKIDQPLSQLFSEEGRKRKRRRKRRAKRTRARTRVDNLALF